MTVVSFNAMKSDAPGADQRPLLDINNLQIIYDDAIEAVRDVSLSVPEGSIVALLGSNGAGKSTVLKALSGMLEVEEGEVEKGSITFRGERLDGLSAEAIVRKGIVQVPEGRRLFINLSVEENLMMGGYLQSHAELRIRRDAVFELFPRVAEKRNQIAGYLSGGEQQMLAMARMLRTGVAPLVIEAIYEAIVRLRGEMGVTILLVEQSAAQALSVADYGYILENGRVVLDGDAPSLERNAEVQEFYLGYAGGGERKSFREVKHYKRRKRWLS